MNYQTYEPDQDLTDIVKCYWTLESWNEVVTEKQTVIPDGCMEMIFHLGDLYLQYDGNGLCFIQPRCFVMGQLTRPLEIEPTGNTSIFSVRFHPNGFLPFAAFPIKEMENSAVSLERLFGKEGRMIEEHILNAHSTLERIKFVEKFLFDKLTEAETVDRIVKSTVDTILTANGQLTIQELSKLTLINRRQLERKFSAAVGLSPKQLSKTIRLQSTLKMLLNKEVTNLTALAYEGAYYDQAHFIKDFKELTGFTPKDFYVNRLKMTSFFIGD